jgi:alkylhydroperoxidase family enzyme
MSDAHTRDAGFLGPPEPTDAARRMLDHDVENDGYVMNLTRVWAHVPAAQPKLSELLDLAVEEGGLTFRERCVLVTATAAELGDAYCSLAWGRRLAGQTTPGTAAAVIRGEDTGLDDRDRALARWARRVAGDPNGTTAADIEELRSVGYDDRQVLAITLYVAGRLAFSTVNDALGAAPDPEVRDAAPAEVRDAVTYGRPPA